MDAQLPSKPPLPSVSELATVNNYVKKRGLTLLSTQIFEELRDHNLYKHVRPPTKRHLGTKLRSADPFPTLPCVGGQVTADY